MKFTFFRSRSKRGTGTHFQKTSIVSSPRNSLARETLIKVNDRCNGVRQEAVAGTTPVIADVLLTDKSPYAREAIQVVGCRIENSSSEYEKNELASIVRHIEEVYRPEVAMLIDHRHSYDTTIVVDLVIDRFSTVSAVEILHPVISGNDIFRTDVEKTVLQWRFPMILRQGKCRVAFSRKSTV